MILAEEHVGLARHVLGRLHRSYDEDDLAAALLALVEAATQWNARRPSGVAWPTFGANRITWSRLNEWRAPTAQARRLEVALYLSSPDDEEAEIERPEMARADPDLARTEARVDVENLLAGIPELEVRILRRRFGLEGEPASVDELAAELRIPRSRVRRLEQKTIETLRKRARPRRFQKLAAGTARR